MPVITSEKTRRYTFIVDEAIEPGLIPDSIALFHPDGTPITFEASDPDKMKWLGEWDVGTEYVQNDVVKYNDSMYIVENDVVIAPAEDSPDINVNWVLLVLAGVLPVGGTTGQVLAKASATDGDVEWIDAAAAGGGGSVEIVTSKRFYESLDATPGSLSNSHSGSSFFTSGIFDDIPGMRWGTGGDNNQYSRDEAFRDLDSQIKFTLGATLPTGASWAMVRRVSSTKQLMFFTDFTNGIHLFKLSGSWVLLNSVGFGGYVFQPDTSYWLRGRMDDTGFLTLTLYEDNPKVDASPGVIVEVTHQLAGSDLTDLGPDKPGLPGMRLVGSSDPGPIAVRMNDYEVNEYVQTTAPATVIDANSVIVAP